MYSYILLALSFALIAVFILICRKRMTWTEDCEASPRHVLNEKVIPSTRQSVPGHSPAYYTGDPSNDVLVIEALHLEPNPPKDKFTLALHGNIKESIGVDPQILITVYLNGHIGPTAPNTLAPGPTKMEIIQDGKSLPDGKVPTSGKVIMSYKKLIPYTWLKKGWYTVRVEMYASKEAGRARLTGFEGSIWIEGGEGDGCGGWS